MGLGRIKGNRHFPWFKGDDQRNGFNDVFFRIITGFFFWRIWLEINSGT